MHLQINFQLISFRLNTIIHPSPLKHAFCFGSPFLFYKITNFSFIKHTSSSPDVCPIAIINFDIANIYHGFSSKCSAGIDNHSGAKFDGSALYNCDDEGRTQFRRADDGTVEMTHKWTCDTPGLLLLEISFQISSFKKFG